MGAWGWLLQLRSRGTRGGEGWTNSCKLWPSPMCMRCPLGFPNPKSPLKSPQWAGTGGEIPGQICCWAVAGHAGTPRVSCPLAQPDCPSPRLSGQPLPSDGTQKCQIQTKQLQICGVPGGEVYQGSGQGFLLRSAWRSCSLSCTSHTQE